MVQSNPLISVSSVPKIVRRAIGDRMQIHVLNVIPVTIYIIIIVMRIVLRVIFFFFKNKKDFMRIMEFVNLVLGIACSVILVQLIV